MRSIQSIIKDIATDLGTSVLPDYSGRSMYGIECLGVSGSKSECMQVIKACIVELHNEAQDEANDDTDYGFDMAIELLFDYYTDSMGTGVVLYWPSMQDD